MTTYTPFTKAQVRAALVVLCNQIAKIARKKGVRSPEGRPEIEVARMHQELSHVLDTYSKRNPKSRYLPKFTRRDEALANLVIRIFDFSERYHIPITSAILAKMDHNESRPPKGGRTDGETNI